MSIGSLRAFAFSSACVAGVFSASAQPLTTAFTYQGELSAGGTPAAGAYDLRFRLYDAASGGNQIGSTLCADNTSVANGRFEALLDFGGVFSGRKRFLEIEVRQDSGLDCSDASGYTLLTTRQELTAAPNATFAVNAASATTATNALNLGGTPAANVATLNGNQAFTGLLNFTNPANTFSGIFSGDGSALTALNGGNLAAGTVTRSRVASDIESILSQWTAQPEQPDVPRDAVAWGLDVFRQNDVPQLPPGLAYTAVAAGFDHSLGLRSDGSVAGWGANRAGQLDIPALPPGVTFTALAAGVEFSLGLRSDGTVEGWGINNNGQAIPPALPPGVTYTSVAAGSYHALALRSDGSVVAWGDNTDGQTDVPALPQGLTYAAIGASSNHSLGLRSDGTVIGWGNNSIGQIDTPALAPGVTYISVAAGDSFSLGLRSDGTVAGWGWNASGQATAPALPPGLTYTSVAAGQIHSVALRSDGLVVVFGSNVYGQLNVPELPSDLRYSAVAAGAYHSIALRVHPIAPRLSSANGISIGTTTPPAAGGINVLTTGTFGGRVYAAGLNVSGTARFSDLVSGNTFRARAGTPGLFGVNNNGFSFSSPGDTDGGMFSTADGLLQFFTDLTEKMRINANGNVGIGTTSPTNRLSVSGDADVSGSIIATSFTGSAAGLTGINASNIATGTLGAAQIPNLDASKITAGTFGAAQIPNLDASKITTGTLGAAQIPNLDASKITAGTLANTRTSGTNANTANTLVQRDASGNFSAGTITGNLNGNATSATSATTATTATAATNATQLNAQPASYYTNATNLVAGTLPDARLSTNVPRLDTNTVFAASLGVGVSTPNQRLHVRGSGLFGDTGVENFAIGFDSQLNARVGLLKKASNSPQFVAVAASPIIFSHTNQADIFTNIGGSILTERLRIHTNGNIGVNTNNPIQTLDVNGRMNLTDGVIQRGGTPITSLSDLGLYSSVSGDWIRFVTTSGEFRWFTDGGAGTTHKMRLDTSGNLSVVGSLSKGGGSFKIDHPLDPENKYLYHSFVESPDMMNVYNGNVTTDANGYATITMPDYFEALNRDFRYQLTVVDGATFALVRVSRKIAGNTFEIASSIPNIEVSWQVTGIRHDAWAEKNRIPNSVDKVGAEKGKLLHPEAFNQPVGRGVNVTPAASEH